MLNFMPIVYKTHNSVDLTNGQKIRRHLTENADFFSAIRQSDNA